MLPNPNATPSATISVRASLQITPLLTAQTTVRTPQPYRSYPTAINNVNMYGSAGPTPGMLSVTNNLATGGGTVVNLSQLTALGGLCRIVNNDPINTVTVGIYIPSVNIFVPFADVWSNEIYIFRLSQFLQSEEPGTGTGTYGLSELMIRTVKGNTSQVLVEAFDP